MPAISSRVWVMNFGAAASRAGLMMSVREKSPNSLGSAPLRNCVGSNALPPRC